MLSKRITTMQEIRIWDLPTRVFHWTLATCVIAMIVAAKVGGNAMNLHIRLGYAVFALLLFRLLWGFVGGHWSRFASFLPSPASLRRYLSGQASATDTAGHTPLGSLSVFAMLTVLALQVGSGLFADDEIAYSGPLTSLVSGATIDRLTSWHINFGQYLVIGLVALHLLAILVYLLRQQNLVLPMLSGDKQLAEPVPVARDSAGSRLLALVLLGLAAAVVYWVVQLGAQPMLG